MYKEFQFLNNREALYFWNKPLLIIKTNIKKYRYKNV